jgi:GT2 family glycosyltransferase
MDDDVVPENNCLENLLKYAKEDLLCSPFKKTNENKI